VTDNVQTTLVPVGGAAMVEFEMQVPGNYILILVYHAISRAFNKGALGIIAATGPEGESAGASTTAERIAFGERVYTANCSACHQASREDIPVDSPPLAASDYLNADGGRAIGTLVNGLDGVTTVNGVMPALQLSDGDVANVLTYVYSQWGNSGLVVLPSEVGPGVTRPRAMEGGHNNLILGRPASPPPQGV